MDPDPGVLLLLSLGACASLGWGRLAEDPVGTDWCCPQDWLLCLEEPRQAGSWSGLGVSACAASAAVSLKTSTQAFTRGAGKTMGLPVAAG